MEVPNSISNALAMENLKQSFQNDEKRRIFPGISND